MLDLHGYENETDGGWVPGLETKRQAGYMRRNTGRLMLEPTDPRTETLGDSAVENPTRATEQNRGGSYLALFAN